MAEPHVALITTGGTIACTATDSGALEPTRSAEELLASAPRLPELAIRPREAGLLDSAAMGFAEIDALGDAVDEALADDACVGVVVTHGTDTMEETALALELRRRDDRPVVLTGAMRPADHPEPDGPGNLADALALAAGGATRPGVTIAVAGRELPAFGTVKHDAAAVDAFRHRGGELPRRLPGVRLAGVDVRVVAAYPGTPSAVVDAAARGADGLVVEALGAGNVGPEAAEGLKRALRSGAPVVISTRAAAGPVALAYGGAGGGAGLADLGAIGSGVLRAGQARVLLAAALAAGVAPASMFGQEG